MTKKYLIELAEYNVWANSLIQNWLNQLTAEQWSQKLIGSFESIESTTIHLASAEKIWLERLENNAQEFLQNTFKGDKKHLIEIWKTTSENLQKYMYDSPESSLTDYFNYKNLKGESFTSQRYQVLVHVFNHSTYHRGQLVNYLRQVGYTAVSSTDFINFYRLKESGKIG